MREFGKQIDLDLLDFNQPLPLVRQQMIDFVVQLPDFKFGPGACAKALAKTPWSWETVTENLRQVHDWGDELTIRQATGGQVDLLAEPAARAPAHFGLRAEILNGIYPSLSDCHPGAQPDERPTTRPRRQRSSRP